MPLARSLAFGHGCGLRHVGPNRLKEPLSSSVRRCMWRASRFAMSADPPDVGDLFAMSPYAELRAKRVREMRAGRGYSELRARPEAGRNAVKVEHDQHQAGDTSAAGGSAVENAESPPTFDVTKKYANHDDFVSGVLKLHGDPLESSGRVVIHRGNPKAKLMIIGEAPGRDEDLEGMPFVGKAGVLLDDIFTYAGFDMSKHVYITNVVKRRPPNNRTPTDTEIDFYLPLLLEEIRLVDPFLVILAGAVPLKAVLNMKAYLLRNPKCKFEMKDDIDEIRRIYIAKFPDDHLAEPRRHKPRRAK